MNIIKIVICSIFISVVSLQSAYAASVEPQYAIYVDAGSTGSRLYLFKMDTSADFPVIKTVFSASTKPGISSFAAHPEDAGVSFKKMMDDATQYLVTNGIDAAAVPVSIMATAGMRLVSESSQQAIYQSINTYMKAHYVFPVRDVKTITGQEEALYGWLDVNYLSGTFQHHLPLLGSVDVGGASAEIAFVTYDESVNPNDIVKVTIQQQTYPVFAKSYLGLGQDQAREAVNKTADSAYCYPQEYVTTQGTEGRFSFNDCAQQYQNFVKKVMTEELPLTLGTSFVAYSGIYYDYIFFSDNKQPNHATYESHVQKICGQTWSEIKMNYPDVPEKYLATDCPNGVYIDQLIYDDYHLTDDQLTISNQINGEDIDWVLGAALYSLIKI